MLPCCSARADVSHFDLGEHLPVVLLPQIVRAALELHDRYLAALAVPHHRGEHLAALEGGLAHLDVGALPDEQHFAELDGGTGLRVEFLDAQHAIFGNPILLAACGDDRVHSGWTEQLGQMLKAAHSTGALCHGQTALSSVLAVT